MSNYKLLLHIVNNSNSQTFFFDDGTFRIVHHYRYKNRIIDILSYYHNYSELTLYLSTLEYVFKIDQEIISSLLKPYFQEKYKLKVENIGYI